jgi:cell wall-associated NlpC family hydrolase
MAVRFWWGSGVVLVMAFLMAGCAGAPRLGPEVLPPPSPPSLSARKLALKQAIDEFRGVPYLSGGTTPHGADCSGLVQAVFHRAGVNLPRTTAQQFAQGRHVDWENLEFGDVLFFNQLCKVKVQKAYLVGILPPDYSELCHNGIYLGQGQFLHASPSRGVHTSRFDDQTWQTSFMGARRYLGD